MEENKSMDYEQRERLWEEIGYVSQKGVNYLNSLNSYNYTQGLIIRNNKVIAKETSKGTKRMLQLLKNFKNFQDILIKFPKKRQDFSN